MAVYYQDSCESGQEDHFCDPCAPGELGRIRSVAFVKKGYTFADPTDTAEWQAAVAAGNAIIIAEVNGSFDGGSPKTAPGYGDNATEMMGYDFKLSYKDPNYKQNVGFYNTLKNSRKWRLCYRTETQIHFSTNTCAVLPKTPVTDDISAKIHVEVEVQWSDRDLPLPHDMPEDIFSCFLLTA